MLRARVSPCLIFRGSGNTQGLFHLKPRILLGLGLAEVNAHLVLQLQSTAGSYLCFFELQTIESTCWSTLILRVEFNTGEVPKDLEKSDVTMAFLGIGGMI